MSADIDLMQALILQHANRSGYPCDRSSTRTAAKALYDAGFRLASTPTDEAQNDRLRSIEDRLARLEGYMVVR